MPARKKSLELTKETLLLNFLREANLVIALINKRYFTRGEFRSIEDIKTFRYVPKDYVKLYHLIWKSNDIDELYDAGLEIWGNLLKFAKVHKIENRVEANNFHNAKMLGI